MPNQDNLSQAEYLVNHLLSTDDNDHHVFQSPGGQKPRPIVSSWCLTESVNPPKKREDQTVYYVDDLLSREMITEVEDYDAGMALVAQFKADGIRTCLREETITEDDLQEQSQRDRNALRYSRGFGA